VAVWASVLLSAFRAVLSASVVVDVEVEFAVDGDVDEFESPAFDDSSVVEVVDELVVPSLLQPTARHSDEVNTSAHNIRFIMPPSP